MDLIAAERDGGDAEAVKAAYRAKKEEAKKAALDSQMVRILYPDPQLVPFFA